MVIERFTVVALPHSRAANADFHVSLFISPDLTPDGPVGKLAQFPLFEHWASTLRNDSVIELFDQNGAIEIKALRDVVDPEVWDAVFPSDTRVRGRKPIDWKQRHWRTFSAAELHDQAKLLHAAAIYSSPTSPPSPSAHPLSGLMQSFGVKFHIGRTGRTRYDESIITQQLDHLIGETRDPGTSDLTLADLENIIDEKTPMPRFALQLHRARRFYERPEALEDYRKRPIEGLTRPRPDKPDPDFHQRCTLVADHPSLQRQLGLVVDLKVNDPVRLGDSSWLSARIVPSGDRHACRLTRTRCMTDGEELVTVPAGEDWDHGRLRLGDPDSFDVLDMDPDGTALKLDRFLWTFPRLALSEANESPTHAAPPALRSAGFTVVRRKKALETQDRLNRQVELYSTADQSTPLLFTEDVNQGLRVEVWDDRAGRWLSLHQRRITATVDDHGVVVNDSPEVGFIQGTTATETPDVEDSPVHVHESIFGWEGWSLSAERPGKRVRHQDGEEIVENTTPDPNPVTPLAVTTKVEPGTLPPLRYSHDYAFRAWGVDLAGNSRRHEVGPVPTPSPIAISAVSAAVVNVPRISEITERFSGELRTETSKTIERRSPRPSPPNPEQTSTASILGAEPDAEREVLRRLRAVRAKRPHTSRSNVDRESLVARAFADSLADGDQPMLASTAILDPERIGRATDPPIAIDPGVVSGLVATITPLKPFLRWDPVQPPATVARHPFSAGESLLQVVIRSGVTQDLETLKITITEPDAYAAAAPSDHRYRATSERHFAPPKTSQSEAELHGAFDNAIGSNNPDDYRDAQVVAMRESGTFFDMEVPRLSDPSQSDPQIGIALENDPNVPEITKKHLPLPQGFAPAPGQYIIHDTDQLVLPYLPDVVGRGISLVFPEAGRDRHIVFPFGTEGFTARYQGVWPERQPFRLVLHHSEELTGALDGNVLGIGLPPGDIQRFRLASCLDRGDLELFGLWRSLPDALRANGDVAEAAADGWLWALTPFDDVTLVHAVPRPVEIPEPTKLFAIRGEDSTDAHILGAVDVHGPSTDSLTLEARWEDPVDDLSMPAPFSRKQRGVAFTTKIRPEEDLAILGADPENTIPGVDPVDSRRIIPGVGPVWFHVPIHRIGDTKHRTINYRFRAATRFPEYFDLQSLEPAPPADPGDETPVDDGQSVVGPEVVVSMPSSAMPAAPVVHSVLPLFRWEAGTEPEQPVAVRRRRRAGVRIYLERPWFSSGDDELLGVLLAPKGNDVNHDKIVSQWGADPVWLSAPVDKRAMFLEFDNLAHALGLDDDAGDALPVTPPATYFHPADKKKEFRKRRVTVLGYRPVFSAERNMWYVDVAIEPGSSFWPFVRLSVARYQPDSIPGCRLSQHVRCDFVQLTPERTTSVSRTDVRHVRVVMSGPVGLRLRPEGGRIKGYHELKDLKEYAAAVSTTRTVVARLQRRHPDIPTDLGWENVAVSELTVRGFGSGPYEASWVGELEAPEEIPLQRPGDQPDWRVVVEEWERLPGDPANLKFLAVGRWRRVWEHRLIYADEIVL